MNSNNMIKRFLSFAIVLAALLFPCRVEAQLTMQPGTTLTGWTPDSLVRNVLLGAGVEVYNVRFNGSLTSINCTGVGKFTGGNGTNLGMDAGIVLSASGLDYINTTGGSSTSSCPTYNDADLHNLVLPYDINNTACLEFDFVPRSDSVSFRYVFASEEYYQWECSQYNDAFAFFLTGVRPSGGNYPANNNIALIPETTTPITINTVNGGETHGSVTPCITTNTQYFVDNRTMTYVKHMDGFTTVLTAKAAVIPCQTYHLKMVVANVSDDALPSAVFLEANSLTSNAISFAFDNSANPMAPSDLYEGCQAKVVMTRPQQKPTNTTIHVQVEGDVSNGVDFENWNSVFSFPANSDTVIKILAPYVDNEIEGTEFARFVMWADGGCMYSDTMEFNILDVEPLNVTIEHDTLTSSTTNVQLRANITGGMPNRTVTWTDLLHPTSQPRTGEAIMVNTFNDMRWLVEVEPTAVCGSSRGRRSRSLRAATRCILNLR